MSDSIPIRHAIHEAAHAVAALALGIAPRSVSVSAAGGNTALPGDISSEHKAIIAVAGAVAERIVLGDDRATLSASDESLLRAAADELGCSTKSLLAWGSDQAAQIVGTHEAEVIELSNTLLRTPQLAVSGLRNTCRPFSPLFKYRALFPAPKPKPLDVLDVIDRELERDMRLADRAYKLLNLAGTSPS